MEEFPKARGGKELKGHLRGDRLTLRKMALAKCYDCMGRYADGKQDCEMQDCPLYPAMPYQTKIPVFKSRTHQHGGFKKKKAQEDSRA